MSDEVKTSDGLGLDKAARNALNRIRDQDGDAEEETPELEPPFPYKMIPFNPSFFDT